MTNKLHICMLAATLSLPAQAHAQIVCDGAYQVLPTGKLSTPFCQDEDLARQARGKGAMVTGEAVRRSPALKESLCKATQDNAACANYDGE